VTVKQEETTDSAADIRKSLAALIESADGSRARVVDSEAEADLIVEVLTRRKKSGFPAFWQFVYLKVTPVGWDVSEDLGNTAFDRIEREGELGVGLLASSSVEKTVKTIRPYGAESPFWVIEVGLQGRNWSELGSFGAEVIHGLVEPPAAPEDS